MNNEVTCTKCGGDGLIGAGPEPHLKQGRLSTCNVCGGTGKITVERMKSYQEERNGVPAQPEQITPEAVEEQKAQDKPKGFIARLFGK